MRNTISAKIIRSKADILHLIELIETNSEKAKNNKDLILDNLQSIRFAMDTIVRLNDRNE